MLDVKSTFVDLGFWGIYDVFSGLFYTMLMAVGVLSEACNLGIEQNLVIFAEKALGERNLEERTTTCVDEKGKEIGKGEDYTYKWSDLQIDREINRMYGQAFLER